MKYSVSCEACQAKDLEHENREKDSAVSRLFESFALQRLSCSKYLDIFRHSVTIPTRLMG